MKYYKSDAEFNVDVKRLNALIRRDSSQWQYTQARKDHEDFFGVEIKIGESYFKRQYGAAYDDVLKLSRLSMERLLFAVFAGNSHLEYSSDQLLQKQRAELRKALEGL